jgi:hypothetical protein
VEGFGMKKLRNMLWKYLGITLDKQTYFIIGIVSISCIAAMVFGILAASTNSTLFRLLFVFTIIPAATILLGSINRPLMWGLSTESERKEIEQELALKQLKRRAKDSHFER